MKIDKRILLCALVSFLLNTSYLYASKDRLVLSGDALGYDAVGWDLAQGKGFPTSGGVQPKRPPLYLMFVGAIYYVTGHDPQSVRWIQGAVAAAFSVLVYLLARRLVDVGLFPERVAWLAAWLTVLYPGFVFYSGVLYREVLIVLFVLLVLLFLTRYQIAARPRDAIGFGVCLGLTSLIDNRFVYYPIVLVGMLCLLGRTWRQPLVLLVLGSVAMAVVIAPWTIRNYVVFHRFVPIATAQDKGLWKSTHPAEFLEWDWTREPLKTYWKMDPEEREKLMAREAIENLKRYPFAYVKMSAKRFGRLWLGGHSNLVPGLQPSVAENVDAGHYGLVTVKLFFVALNMTYLVGGAVGFLLLWRRAASRYLGHFLALVVYLAIIHTLVFAAPRYHLPLIPIFTLFLAYALYSFDWRRRVELAPSVVGGPAHGR